METKKTDADLVIDVLQLGGRWSGIDIAKRYNRVCWAYRTRISDINKGKVNKYAGTIIKSAKNPNSKVFDYWLDKLVIEGVEYEINQVEVMPASVNLPEPDLEVHTRMLEPLLQQLKLF